MKHFINLLAVIFLLSACSTTIRQETGTRSKPSSVLFIGNSYSFNVPKELRRVASREGRKLRVGQITIGGWTLAQHVARGEASRAIREGKWGFVVIQEQSLIPANPYKRPREMFPNVRKLASEARDAGSVPVLYQTWGRQHGNPRLSAKDDFKAMNRRVREGYHEAAREAGGLTIVPAGDVWEREVAAGRGEMLYMPDGSHPTPYAERLIAETFYRTLFLTEKPQQPLQHGQ
jgi:hypothetical protein